MSLRISILLFPALYAVTAFAQSTPAFTCQSAAQPPVLHAEGVTERLGDIVLNCSGSPGGTANANFALFSNVPVTNRLGANNTVDAILAVNTGSGDVLSGIPAVITGTNQLSFNGVVLTIPSTGVFTLRFTNIRGDLTRLPAGQTAQILITSTGQNQFAITNPTLVVGVTSPSLYSTTSGVLTCSQFGSPVPSTLTLTNFLSAGSGFASTRVTEGFVNALEPRQPLSDNGTRIAIKYSGFPTGATVYAPDVVAGADATSPTSAGAFGQPVSGGIFTAGNPSLVLARVINPNSDGSGGTLAYTPGSAGSGAVAFGTYSAVSLANGSGMAVYEVVNANAAVVQTAQIVSFLGLPRGTVAETVNPSLDVVLAPVSAVGAASATAPIVRYSGGSSGPDCGVLGDCNAPYNPALALSGDTLNFSVPQGLFSQARFVQVSNAGGGLLQWSATVHYTNGSGWLQLTPASGINAGVIRVDALTSALALGTYKATVTVDATNGSKQLPVTLTVTGGTAGQPIVLQAINAATYANGAFVAGSLGTIKGSFAGTTRSLMLGGYAATILYQDNNQINFVVPSQLAGVASTPLIVTVDNVASTAMMITLAPSAPGVFSNGILNQDYSVNSASAPARAGSVIQVFGTGFSIDRSQGAKITGKIGDRVLTTVFDGGAPGFSALQQVNLQVPADLATGSYDLAVCNSFTSAEQACSLAVKLNVTR